MDAVPDFIIQSLPCHTILTLQPVCLQLSRMVGMISRIQQTISRSVPLTSAAVEEVQHRSRCWSRDSGLKAGTLENDGDVADEAGQHIVLDVGRPFMHAFIIPNYKVLPRLRSCVRI